MRLREVSAIGAGENLPSIVLPFDGFQLVDLTFDLTVRMDRSEPGEYRLFVTFKSLCKPLYFDESALGNPFLPVFSSMSFTLAKDEMSKKANEMTGCVVLFPPLEKACLTCSVVVPTWNIHGGSMSKNFGVSALLEEERRNNPWESTM